MVLVEVHNHAKCICSALFTVIKAFANFYCDKINKTETIKDVIIKATAHTCIIRIVVSGDIEFIILD
ncbi:hypothetical protein IB672_08490 [Francisella orientalis]|uniref:hypothetical protein n=1 Tax=Francisella orientalis TaxID=299583 RepID=UPI0014193B8E|nr:hypothetical protein [Francisella orientalis]MBK2080182.1 hypothetical protein [Francisella orientalis]MBK2087030.1 hypothetical protein [Francisella orientalis]